MSDKEKDVGRREVLRKLTAAAFVGPVFGALAACSETSPGMSAITPPAQPITPAAPPATPPVKPATTTPATPSPAPAAGASGGMSAPVTPTPAPAMPPAPAPTTPMATGGAPAMPPANPPMMAGVDFGMLDCIATPEQTEGPFFMDMQMERSDLITGETDMTVTAGIPVELTLGVFQVNGTMCSPVSGAQVDIWHADTQGVYSNIGRDNPNSFIQPQDTGDKKFCRGWQKTGEDGVVKFKTIYPGFYGSRAIHIHFKIRMPGESAAMAYTSQFYFDDKLSDKVLAESAYKKMGMRVTNRRDQVYTGTGPGCCPAQMVAEDKHVVGDETLLKLEPDASGKGYTASFKIGMKMG